MYELGSIICIRNFLPQKEKGDKLFIVLGLVGDSLNLMGISTSKIYFDESLLRPGKIVDRDNSFYCFFKGQIIGKNNNFCFFSNTIFSLQSKPIEFTQDKLASYTIDLKDTLIDSELYELIYFYKSNIQSKYVSYFDNILQELYNKLNPSEV